MNVAKEIPLRSGRAGDFLRLCQGALMGLLP
jgi:hypothetical protein